MPLDEHDKILVPYLGGYECIPLNKISHVQSDGNACIFFLTDKSTSVSSYNLGHFELRLVAGGFIRVHASHIVNFIYIKRYVRGDGGTVVMEDGSEVDVSRSHKQELVSKLEERWGCPAQIDRIINDSR